jgi:hypothetical protein
LLLALIFSCNAIAKLSCEDGSGITVELADDLQRRNKDCRAGGETFRPFVLAALSGWDESGCQGKCRGRAAKAPVEQRRAREPAMGTQ